MSDNREIAIKISNVKKMYKLGQIGGGTLQADLQSWWARKRGKEDPNVKIGQEDRARLVGQTFMALNGIDLTIYKGEAVGIIGSNGAGKSTMLKLLSRVTAPTSGEIDIYGRITSMLEVGTGFNGEMTGRENVYLNGAILGMTKAEIDAKMEQIIEFSEVRDFIDTPVKRYSSGMYVKLAFSVAAHLDSEIMIMDEVLAVGDMAFQKKCLDKMRDAAKQEGRTVLYVSHNMNTIRQLCDRCIVLDKGKVIFDGDVESAIEIYSQNNSLAYLTDTDLESAKRYSDKLGKDIRISRLLIKNSNGCYLRHGTKLEFDLYLNVIHNFHDVCFRCMLYFYDGTPISMAGVKKGAFTLKDGLNTLYTILDTSALAPGKYYLKLAVYRVDDFGNEIHCDVIDKAVFFEIDSLDTMNNMVWLHQYWGHSEIGITIKAD